MNAALEHRLEKTKADEAGTNASGRSRRFRRGQVSGRDQGFGQQARLSGKSRRSPTLQGKGIGTYP